MSPFPARWWIDRRLDPAASPEALRDDLLFYDLAAEGAIADMPQAWWLADPTWRLAIPGRTGSVDADTPLIDARGAHGELAFAVMRHVRQQAGAGLRPTVLVNPGAAAWLEVLAGLHQGEPWALGTQPCALGRGGIAELTVAAFGLEAPAGMLEAAATGIWLANDHWCVLAEPGLNAVRLTRGGTAPGGPRAIEWPAPEAEQRWPEPSPLGTVWRVDIDGSEGPPRFALPDRPGTYKLTAELTGDEWALYQVIDGDHQAAAWMASGPALPGGTYSVRLTQPEARERTIGFDLHAATGKVRSGAHPAPLRQAWLSHLGEARSGTELTGRGGAGADAPPARMEQRTVRRTPAGMASEHRRFQLRAGSPWLEVTIDRAGPPEGASPAQPLGLEAALTLATRAGAPAPGFAPAEAALLAAHDGASILWLCDAPAARSATSRHALMWVGGA